MLQKLLALVFWHLRQVFVAFLHDGFENSKALIILSGAQVCMLMTLLFGLELILRQRLMPGSGVPTLIFSFGLAGAVLAFNYRILLFEDRWRRFEAEFSRYPRHIRTMQLGGISLGILLLVVLTLMAASASSRIG